jgi:channel protein (hemolysin III family)
MSSRGRSPAARRRASVGASTAPATATAEAPTARAKGSSRSSSSKGGSRGAVPPGGQASPFFPSTLTFAQVRGGPPDIHHHADNEHVLSGYRPRMSLAQAALSLFTPHNESINVWTHLLAALTFIFLLVHIATGGLELKLASKAGKAFHNAEVAVVERVFGGGADVNVPVWPVIVFLVSAIVCLSCSTAYHLLHVVNKRVFEVLARMDYVGIAVLIAGSNVALLRLTFHCATAAGDAYTASILALCTAAAVLGLMDRFQKPEWRKRRALVFVLTGLGGVAPAVHVWLGGGAVLVGANAPAALTESATVEISAILSGLLAMGGQYLVGAALYAARIPERFAPGRFDIVFQSHSIFHLLVFGAAYTHYLTVVRLYAWRVANPVCG